MTLTIVVPENLPPWCDRLAERSGHSPLWHYLRVHAPDAFPPAAFDVKSEAMS